MGIISAIIGWLQYHLGIRDDPANSSGSLHAKIAELRTYITTTLQKPRGHGVIGSAYLTTDSYQTVLNISGKGQLNHIAMYNNSASNTGVLKIKITADGVLMAQGTGSVSGINWGYPVGAFWAACTDTTESFSSSGISFAGISFASSLKIEAVRTSSTANPRLLWSYSVE